ncbi:hypothetical protein AMECASPLE_004843 [Ameca splendens]|uniref:Uncharacterized protein n=1 Tax=Ameca splendens TaxID=208324 RepID=A0ABV0XYT2_9TELE
MIVLLIKCHSVVTGVWSLPANVSHPNAWLPVLSPPYSSGHRPLSLATPSPKRTAPPTPHPQSLSSSLNVFFSSLHTAPPLQSNSIFHLLTSLTSCPTAFLSS